jgi:hypothetical protein
MAPPIACVMCMLTVDNTTLIVPVAQATLITVPFLFRHHIVNGVRRRVGRLRADDVSSPDDDQRVSASSTVPDEHDHTAGADRLT